MTTALTSSQVDQYHRDGFLCPVRVLTEEEAAVFRRELESVIVACPEGALRRLDGLHLYFPWAYRLVTKTSLLDVVEGLLGPELLIDGTLVFYKPPRDTGYVSWHQDSAYSDWHLSPSTSAWIALSSSHRANGCMRVIPGSHHAGTRTHINDADSANLLFRGESVATVEESEAVDVVLQPGEMSLHQSTLVHGSDANSSDEPRIGFIVRFVTERIGERKRPLLRVRGKADCSHLELAHPPNETSKERAMAAWRAYNGF